MFSELFNFSWTNCSKVGGRLWKVRRGKLCGMAYLSHGLPLISWDVKILGTRTWYCLTLVIDQKAFGLCHKHACVADQTTELMYLQIYSQLLKHCLAVLPLAAAPAIPFAGYQLLPLSVAGLPYHCCSARRLGQLLSLIRSSLVSSLPQEVPAPLPWSHTGALNLREMPAHCVLIFHPSGITHKGSSRVVVVFAQVHCLWLLQKSKVRFLKHRSKSCA